MILISKTTKFQSAIASRPDHKQLFKNSILMYLMEFFPLNLIFEGDSPSPTHKGVPQFLYIFDVKLLD